MSWAESCPHDDILLVEGGYERTWDWDDSGDTPVATFHGLDDFSDRGDGNYVLRCASCLKEFPTPEEEWEWD